jgi:transposase-like protein
MIYRELSYISTHARPKCQFCGRCFLVMSGMHISGAINLKGNKLWTKFLRTFWKKSKDSQIQ